MVVALVSNYQYFDLNSTAFTFKPLEDTNCSRTSGAKSDAFCFIFSTLIIGKIREHCFILDDGLSLKYYENNITHTTFDNIIDLIKFQEINPYIINITDFEGIFRTVCFKGNFEIFKKLYEWKPSIKDTIIFFITKFI